MYQPKPFRIDEHTPLHNLIKNNALGILVTTLDGTLEVNHVPVVLDIDSGDYGRLRFHLARANPLADWLASSSAKVEQVVFVFRAEQAYISPDWYGQENMVPTWNYAVAHAHGLVEVLDDDALVSVLNDLSAAQEGRLPKAPWTTQKMDQNLYEKMRRAIIGFQMPIARLEGKFKMSQNRPPEARAGVIRALSDLASENDQKTAETMHNLLVNEAHKSPP